MFFGTFFTAVFLFIPEIFTGIFQSGNEMLPVFNISFIQSSWRIILLMWGVGFLKDLCKFMYSRYNGVVLGMTVVTNGVSAFLTYYWLRSGELMNPQFMEKILNILGREEEWLVYVFANIQQVLLVVIIFGLAVDVINTVFRVLVPRR